jgi:dTDP-4-amino-4,6-dideoxygalactose transaminase
MKSKDIGVNVHYIPIYHHPFYRKMGFKVGYCENAENYYKTCITLPLYPDLSDQQYNYITDAINEYF